MKHTEEIIAVPPGRRMIEEVREHYMRIGLLERQPRYYAPPRPFTDAERAEIRRLRRKHTLSEIAAMFQGRHPSTIHLICAGIAVDFRSKRKGRQEHAA